MISNQIVESQEKLNKYDKQRSVSNARLKKILHNKDLEDINIEADIS